MGTAGSWVCWGAWEEEADGGGKLRHGGRKGVVPARLGLGGPFSEPALLLLEEDGETLCRPRGCGADAKRSPHHRGVAASPTLAGSCPWGSRTPCLSSPPPLPLMGQGLVKGFLRHTLLIRQTTPWELPGGKLPEPWLHAGLGTEGPGVGGWVAPGDLSPPPCSFVTLRSLGLPLLGSDGLWGQWEGWERGTLAQDPGSEGAAIVPPAELAAGEVIRPLW